MKFPISALVLSITLTILPLPTMASENFETLFRPAIRGDQSDESVYFVMTDRFENADPSNDNGGATEGKFTGGYLPNDIGWWHGGDFVGLKNRIPYIKKMGFTSIWITPPVKQIVYQGNSSGYHGYWGLDFMTVDPHLGTEDEFKALVSEAHKVGLKIILDVVANHTADVIQYKNNQYGYIGSNEFAYKDAKGKVFDVKKVAGKETFPKLSVTKSFPRIPIVSPANAKIKNPAWLNDLTNYHNRGNSSFNGESSLDGDFYGLDDIFTEKPEVVQGWIDIWSYWINNFDIDGLRIDTLKHVNPSFWQTVIPRIQKVAQLKGKTDFPIFGEVYDADPFVLSSFIRSKQSPSLLDFAFQKNVVGFARSGDSSQALVSLFNADDLYTTPTSNAYGLATFLGNHDMGRVGLFLRTAVSSNETEKLLERAKLSNAMLFLLRGGPVLYYGDEVGMIGFGGDKEARQDMFPTLVSQWQSAERIGSTSIGKRSSFDIPNPLQNQITTLQEVIAANPALRNGVQQIRFADNGSFVVSRFANAQEYLVAFNGTDLISRPTFKASTTNTGWTILNGDCKVSSDLTVTLEPRAYCVLKANEKHLPTQTPVVTLRKVSKTLLTEELLQLSASVAGNDYVEVAFLVRKVGRGWRFLGTSDRRTFTDMTTVNGLHRVFLDPREFKNGSNLELIAVARGSNQKTGTSKILKFQIKY